MNTGPMGIWCVSRASSWELVVDDCLSSAALPRSVSFMKVSNREVSDFLLPFLVAKQFL